MKFISSKRFIFIAMLVVLLLAWWARLTYFNQLQAVFPDFLRSKPFCGLDRNVYDKAARDLLAGTWPGDNPFVYMILYPFYLYTVYVTVGINLKIAVILQMLFEVVTCAAVYGIGRLVFNRRAGGLAAFLCAFFAPLIFHSPCFSQENLALSLLTWAIFLILKTQATNKLGYLILAGVVTALAGLSRPTLFVLAPLALLWLWLTHRSWRRVIWQGLVYGGVIFLATLPVTLHNYRTAGQFSPTPVSGWEALFTGNNPVAEGMDMTDYVLYNYINLPGGDYIKSVFAAEARTGTAYYDETIKFVTTQPLAWLELQGRKAYLLLAESDSNLISPYDTHNLQSAPLLRYFPFEWRSAFLGAALGILLLKHRRRSWLPLGVLLILLGVTILFYVHLRFRIMFVPLVLVYTAAFIEAAPTLSRPRLILALVMLTALTPFWPFLGWLTLFFISSALWPYIRQRNGAALRWRGLAAWSYLVLAVLLAQIIAFINQAGQTQAIFRGPQITGPIAVGQTFVVPCNGFNRLQLTFGAFGYERTGSAIFHLRAGLNSPADIYSITLETSHITDRSRHDITFPAQPNSAGQNYFFYLEAPQIPPDQSITLRGTYDQPYNRYPEGSVYAGQPGAWQRLPGDLAFNAYCDVGLLAIIQQAFKQVSADGLGAPVFYWVLLVTHLGMLLLALFKLARETEVKVDP